MDRLLIPILVALLAVGLLLVGIWAVALSVNAARERRGERTRRRTRRQRRKIDLMCRPDE